MADSLARSTGIPFDERPVSSFYHYATIEKETVSELAEKLAKALKPHGCGYVEILGDPDQRVTKLGMGVGAAMNSQIMMLENVDCMILADDGFTNWIDLQWCLDCLLYTSEKETAFIEYAPLETAWVPITGDNYLYLYCLWVTGSFKGKGIGQDFCLCEPSMQTPAFP